MTKEKSRARRDQLAAMRAQQQRKERRTAFLMWGAGGLVIALLVGVVGFYLINERAASSLDAVRTFKYEGSQHTPIKVNYTETPPVGGEHNPVWQNCGIYEEPINSENAVHSMEHGAVWITYRPDLPEAQVNRLKELAAGDYMLLSPYPGLPSPIVVSSWNNQLSLNDAEDPRLPRYIARYKQHATFTPELGAACDQGLSVSAALAPIPTETPAAAPSESPAADATAEPTEMPRATPTP